MIEEVKAWRTTRGSIHESKEVAERQESVDEFQKRRHAEIALELSALGIKRLSKVAGPASFQVNSWWDWGQGASVRLELPQARGESEDAERYYLDVPLTEFLTNWRAL